MKFLMVPPNHYKVNYSINPWMKPQLNEVHWLTAQDQWQGLYNKLIELGAEIHLMDQHPECPDMVFTANAGVVVNGTVLTSIFKWGVRAKEEKYFMEVFKDLKTKGVIDRIIDARNIYPNYAFEGAGDAIYDLGIREMWPEVTYSPRMWFGYGQRTVYDSRYLIDQAFHMNRSQLKLIDPRFYHLDTCFAALPFGEILYYVDAFDQDSIKTIQENSPYQIGISPTEATNFAANVVCIGCNIVTGYCGPGLKSILNRRGYNVHEIPLDMFWKAGGSAACLTLRLDA